MQKGEQTTAYTYDGMGRLLTETEGNTATAYTYTPFGNRATKTVTADGETTQTATYAYDKNNRLTKEQSTQDGQTVVTGYTYDHNGNMLLKNDIALSSEGTGAVYALSETSNTTAFYNYDVRNRLTKYQCGSTNASYTYGADGFRDSKTVNGVTTSFIYDGANIVETKQGETVTDYIRGIGLIKYANGITTAYYFSDDHGSTSSLYGATGTKLADYTYDAFGNEEQVSSTDTNPFRYCGEYTDSETGLVYLRARYYDPQTGRFISEDPAKDGLNWYVYCGNNPVMFVDPWGLEGVVLTGGNYGETGYKYNFVEPSLKKIRELSESNPNEKIGWCIVNAGWTTDDWYNFNEAVKDMDNVHIIIINSTDDLINYINYGRTAGKLYYPNGDVENFREGDKITDFSVFCHGAEGMLALNYGCTTGNAQLNFYKKDIEKIQANAFENPTSYFYSCYTGTGAEESFLYVWYNKVGGCAIGYDGRTAFENIMGLEGYKKWKIWMYGANNRVKEQRKTYGFCVTGAMNYPKAGNNSKKVIFQ